MQDALVAQMQERLSSYLEALDPEALMKLWLPGGMQGLAQIQERFWSQLMGGMAGAGSAGQRAGSRRDERRAPPLRRSAAGGP